MPRWTLGARKLRVEIAAGGVLLLLVLVFPILLIARSTVRPLRKIHRAAEDIAAGNLAARTGVDSRSEVGELAHAFDVMAVRVEQSRSSLLSAAVLEASSDLLLIVREDVVGYASGASVPLLDLPPQAIVGKPLTALGSSR